MLPYINVFGFQLPLYGLISIVGVLVAGFVVLKISKKRNTDKYDLMYTAVVAAVGLFIGAHLLYALTRIEDIIAVISDYGYYDSFWDFLKDLWELASGMVFYGGLYGGLLAGFLFAKKKKYPIGDMSDAFGVFIPLFHIFGRIGCFFAGCCYGMECSTGFSGRVIAQGVRESVKRLPIQLIEAGCLVVLFLVMLFFYNRQKARGNLIFLYLLFYAVIRFVLEFFRGDEIRGSFLSLSTSQWISIITLLWVSIYLLVKSKSNKTDI